MGALQQGAVEPRNVLLPTLIRFGLAAERRAVERPRPKRAVEKIAMPAPVARAVSANLQDVAAAAAPKAPPVDLDSALTEIKRLNAMESELRKMVLDRNKRINALELVVANLIAKMKK